MRELAPLVKEALTYNCTLKDTLFFSFFSRFKFDFDGKHPYTEQRFAGFAANSGLAVLTSITCQLAYEFIEFTNHSFFKTFIVRGNHD